ncbi:sugar kinase [Aquincola sp. S2]|uniref:Sugar kinase n=1 Tax=Pseudaquabacterium terrae TaxID=2732868 RepID=A0ABX2EED5_9BURK|nr:sugar kinase [Aquabacterium terrae]NRF66971.1 sugar kinase [Aquabacterium terrae]
MNPVRRVVLFGECMLELQGEAYGTLRQTFGGDTLNTAVYLARLVGGGGVEVAYATGVGVDTLSEGLLTRWREENVGTGLVRRIEGRLPGMYMIDVDARGERHFSYWRDTSAAKAYFDGDDPAPLEAAAGAIDLLYLSGISLAILPPAGRERLFVLMAALRARGAAVAFDNNYRPRLWPDAAEARDCFARAFGLASITFVTADDHQALLGLTTLDDGIAAARALPTPELVIKRGAAATLVRSDGRWAEAATEPVARVVDTTAAGDSFAAGYLSRRLLGASAVDAARFGNRIAARVIQHPGALIDREAMRDLVPGG